MPLRWSMSSDMCCNATHACAACSIVVIAGAWPCCLQLLWSAQQGQMTGGAGAGAGVHSVTGIATGRQADPSYKRPAPSALEPISERSSGTAGPSGQEATRLQSLVPPSPLMHTGA